MHKNKVILDGKSLLIEDLAAVAIHKAECEIDEAAFEAVKRSREVVRKIEHSDKPVYGISTGYGELSRVRIEPEENGILQRNLIISHSCAVGKALSETEVRAIMLLRLNTLCLGFSGVSPEFVLLLKEFLNRNIIPYVPEKGSLGASGDLANLAHIAAALIGEGEVYYKGELKPTGEVLQAEGLEACVLSGKDGLALINGTPFMTGLGVLSLIKAEGLWQLANATAALTFEALRGIKAAYDPRIHELRAHNGQIKAAAQMLKLLEGSKFADTREGDVQDAYTLRCIPQVHGAVCDTIDNVKATLAREMNAVTDNPLVFPDTGEVISGGNFHGEILALNLDYLAIAVAELADISERRTERLVNPALSYGLPAFLVKSEGLNSGFMIPQYTAACLVSENKVLCHPASVDSIPSSANKEDHVSMGGNAARKLREVVQNTLYVLSIEAIAAAQACDLRAEEEGAKAEDMLGEGSLKLYKTIREIVPYYDKDREHHSDIEAVAAYFSDVENIAKL